MKLGLLAIVLTAVLLPVSGFALEKPVGPVVLVVSGHVANTNSDTGAAFDLAMLEALAGRSGKMETPWTDGLTEFSGPLLRSVMEAAGATGTTLTVKALNDYEADVPFEDSKIDTILATRMNGERMSVRDKGPLFLVYPFDLDASLYNEKHFSRSVWQIKEIRVVE
jgi:hypothetical protein